MRCAARDAVGSGSQGLGGRLQRARPRRRRPPPQRHAPSGSTPVTEGVATVEEIGTDAEVVI